jgi:hypothetical protein
MMIVLLIIIPILIVSFLIVLFINRKTIPEKTIWLLWLQGWGNIPDVVKFNMASWKKHNKDWNIELVSESNLSKYIILPEYILEKRRNKKIKAYSDIIRLSLLNKYGGIWVDATVLCIQPLDKWIYEVIKPNGFWMYSSTFATEGKSRGPCIWFIVSLRKNYIISKWYKEILNYWKYNDDSEYFLTDKLFVQLLETDDKILKEWNSVPILWSKEGYGNSSMLSGMVFDNIDSEKGRKAIENYKEKCPYVLKLSRHKKLREDSIGMYFINESIKGTPKFHKHKLK